MSGDILNWSGEYNKHSQQTAADCDVNSVTHSVLLHQRVIQQPWDNWQRVETLPTLYDTNHRPDDIRIACCYDLFIYLTKPQQACMFSMEPTPQAIVTQVSLSHYWTLPFRCLAFYGNLTWNENHLGTEYSVCTLLGTDAEWLITLPIQRLYITNRNENFYYCCCTSTPVTKL